jgi:hypothetical protein
MHCPSCGTEAPVTQRFCRSCGFSLEKIPELVTQQLSESEHIGEVAEKLQERQLKIERWLYITGIGFTTLVALSLLTGLIYLMLAGNLPLVPGTIILILIFGAMVAGSLGLYSENLKKKLSASSSVKSKTLAEPATTSNLPLEAYQGPLISVTERTTTLLDKNEATKKENN